MSLNLLDRVKETCSSPGTGSVTLLGAVLGFQSFAVIGNGNTCYYAIADQYGANWEVGIGTYTLSGTTLARTTVLSSSAGGTTKANFSSGIQDVFVTYPAEKAFSTDMTLGVSNGGTGLASLTAGYIPYGNGTGAFNAGVDLQFSGVALGVGITPSTWSLGRILQVGGTTALWNDGSADTYLTNNVYYNGGFKYLTTAAATSYVAGAGQHFWSVAPSGTAGNTITFTQAMTIDGSGNLLVGYTAIGASVSNRFTAVGIQCKAGTGASPNVSGNSFNIAFGTGSQLWIDTTNTGTITVVSDYRLKENVLKQETLALPRIMQLNPVQFTRKEIEMYHGSSDIEEGFIAHELKSIIPSAVFGEKDDLTEDGKIQPQSLNWSPVVSVLVKALQELNEKFDAYVASHP